MDPDALVRTLRGLQHVQHSTGAVQDSMHEVVEAAANLFDVDGAGLMVIDESQNLQPVAASDHRAHALEEAQARLGEGPCVDALILDVTVPAADLVAEPRWQELIGEVERHGVRSVLGVPVHVAGSAVGSLDLYRSDVHDWTPAEIEGVASFTRIVENVLGSAVAAHRQGVIVEQLQHALDHRVTIERAVGMLMAHQKLDPVEAFGSLRAMARRERRKVADVALELVSGAAALPADDA